MSAPVGEKPLYVTIVMRAEVADELARTLDEVADRSVFSARPILRAVANDLRNARRYRHGRATKQGAA